MSLLEAQIVEKIEDFELLDKEVLARANIMPKTGLATDYLNVFNEATMLFGLLGDMPDMIEELVAWQFLTYEEHFTRSNFHAKELAIAVFYKIPEDRRKKFIETSNDLGDMILGAIDEAKSKIDNNEDLQEFASETCFALQSAIMILDGMIHGKSAHTAQDDVDALFD